MPAVPSVLRRFSRSIAASAAVVALLAVPGPAAAVETVDLTVTMSGSGLGRIALAPSLYTCNPTPFQCFPYGVDEHVLAISKGYQLAAVATPNAGSRFAGWSGACTGTGTCAVSLTEDRAIDARFENVSQLTVIRTGTGSGSVVSDTPGIDCGPVCAKDYAVGQAVTLTATPAAGSSFTGWSGGGCSGQGPCTLAMDDVKTVTARFAERLPLTVAKSGTGSGTVVSAPAGIDCGATCATTVEPGTTVTLTASPDPGSTFRGWAGGACGGTEPCAVTVVEATSVTAVFAAAPTGSGPPPPALVTPPSPPPLVTPSDAAVKAALTAVLVPPSKACTIKKILKGGCALRFAAPAAGKLTIRWATTVKRKPVTIASATATFAGIRPATVTVRLNATGRRLLRKAGKLAVTPTATYAIPGRVAIAVSKRVTLK